MCTGRVDLSFVLRAFSKGADGVIIGGCWPGECHYVTEGNYDALGNMYLTKKLFEHLGISPDRLRLEWIAASEGTRFAEVMNSFSSQLKELGPLGTSEGIDERGLRARLSAIETLIPYLKLVEREKLRIPGKSEEAYGEFYASETVNALFKDLIADKLAVSQILALLEESPSTTAEIADHLSLTPSDVAKHLGNTSRQGLVKYDGEQKHYVLA